MDVSIYTHQPRFLSKTGGITPSFSLLALVPLVAVFVSHTHSLCAQALYARLGPVVRIASKAVVRTTAPEMLQDGG